MIKFEAKVKVLSVENKTLKTSSGNDFSFTEAVVIDLDEKRPTKMVVRLGTYVEEGSVKTGKTYDAIFLITHNEGRDGRIWNNFILSAIKEKPENIPEEVQNINKEPETVAQALKQAEDFFENDEIPF